jgi:hypothetical protein
MCSSSEWTFSLMFTTANACVVSVMLVAASSMKYSRFVSSPMRRARFWDSPSLYGAVRKGPERGAHRSLTTYAANNTARSITLLSRHDFMARKLKAEKILYTLYQLDKNHLSSHVVTKNLSVHNYNITSPFLRMRNNEDVWGSWCIAPRIFNLSIRPTWVFSFTPRCLHTRWRTAGTNWIDGWMDLRASLKAMAKRKILSLVWIKTRSSST